MGEMLENQLQLERAVDERRHNMTQYKCYTEDDMFTMNGREVCSVLSFWRYSYGALASLQATTAEYLVSLALGIEKAENVMRWTGYDMSYKSKRIEVKSTSYVHPWNKQTSNQRTFSIAPSNNNYWLVRADRDGRKKSRQSDLYVFCLNTDRDVQNHDPLKIDFWDFYVVPTFRIDERCDRIGNPNQKTISIGVVKRMAGNPVKWPELRKKVDLSIREIDQHISELDKKQQLTEARDEDFRS